MPLKRGSSRKIVSANVSKMMHEGYPQKQGVAASLEMARRSSGSKDRAPRRSKPARSRRRVESES